MSSAASAPTRRGRPPQPELWTTFLAHVRAWANEHGHTRVPQGEVINTPTGPYPLGPRAKFYRAAHLQRGALTPEQVTEIEAIPGWTWHPLDSRWQDTFHEIAQHLSAHGTLDGLPDSHSRWLRRQRTAQLNQTQRAQLQTIPGALDPDPIDAFLTAANTWLQAHPDQPITDVRFRDTITTPDGTTYPLGRRATYFRRRTTGQEGTHPLPHRDVQRLEQLRGWTTDPQQPTTTTTTEPTPPVPAPAPAPRDPSRPTTTRTPKYQRLADYLREWPGQRTTLTFQRIADMIRGGLPASAYTRKTWWANEVKGHVHARAWMDNGWRVSSVNFDRGAVTFVRHAVNDTSRAPS